MSLTAFAAWWVNLLLNPLLITLILLTLGAGLMALRYRKSGQAVIYAAAIYLAIILALPLDVWAARPLEDRFARPTLPERIDGILVLEGGTYGPLVIQREAFAAGSMASRLVVGGNLARRFAAARFIFSGGIGDRGKNTAEVAHVVLHDLGVDPSRVIAENRSRNTWENLVFSKERAQPKEGENWLLVTSAVHMPRAMGIAKHLGWKMIPWPSDYLTFKDYEPFGWLRLPDDRFRALNMALHEWVALIAYRMQGRTDTLFPGPE